MVTSSSCSGTCLTFSIPRQAKVNVAVTELAAAGVRIADFSVGQPSLDEVFLALTGHPAEDADGSDDIEEVQAS